VYTQLINLTEDEQTCKVAKTVEEAAKLVESGFDYVTDIDSFKLFKKRKWYPSPSKRARSLGWAYF
jgi:hypothetical protein